MEFVFLFEVAYNKFDLVCLYLILDVSERSDVGTPIDLFLKGGGAHEIELMFEQCIYLSVPLSHVFTQSCGFLGCD